MSEPRREFTQAELVEEATRWMRNYGGRDDKYYEHLGMLVDFVTDLVPKDEKEEA